jgi:outer membrane protein assembly factor BamB
LDDLVALDAQSGSVRWRSTIGGKVIGLSADGAMICLSATLRSPSGAFQSPPWEVEALRAEDGQTLWKDTLPYLPSAPVLGDNNVFLTATGASTAKSPIDLALALSAANGKTLWRVPGSIANLSGGAPTTDGALVYVITYLPYNQITSSSPYPAWTEAPLIKAISAADGQPRWETPLGVLIIPASPVVANGKVFVTFTGANHPDLAVLDPERGSILWRFGGPDSWITTLALPA